YYEYDPISKLLSRAYTGSAGNPISDIRYAYDALYRLRTVTAMRQNGADVPSNLRTTTYSYNAVGDRQSVAQPNGVTTTYTYNTLNRLTDVVSTGPSGTLSSYHYTLSVTGQRLQADENNGGSRTVQYTYDADQRLTQEKINANERIIDYTYDLAGNRLNRNDS